MAINKRLTDTNGVLELNNVTFERTGNMVANYAFKEAGKLENGMLVGIKYNTAEISKKKGDVIGIHCSSEKEYNANEVGLNKFYLTKESKFLPRIGVLVPNDRFTTTSVCYDTSVFNNVDAIKSAIATGVYGVQSQASGYEGLIEISKTAEGAKLKAVKVTTAPNGEPAIQFAVIA